MGCTTVHSCLSSKTLNMKDHAGKNRIYSYIDIIQRERWNPSLALMIHLVAKLAHNQGLEVQQVDHHCKPKLGSL